MTRYRPIPETVEAWRFDGTTTYGGPLRLNGMPWAAVGEVTYLGGILFVGAPSGVQRAKQGDWVIRDRRGDLSVMEHEAFMAAYEPEPAPECIVEQAMAGMRASLREAGTAKIIYHGQQEIEPMPSQAEIDSKQADIRNARNAAIEEAALMAEESAACGVFLADDIRALKTEESDVEGDGFVTIHPTQDNP